MSMKKILFLLLFPLFLSSKLSAQPIPDWVKPVEFSLDAPPQYSPLHIQEILIDQQNHFEEETVFLHRATKALDDIGAKELSQLRFGYDPAYQKIVIHDLKLYRNGEWIDKLSTSRKETLQQEDLLHAGLYTGVLTQLFFLDDVRAGDIIEYAVSIIGVHPVNRLYQESVFYLQDVPSIGKIHYRILASSDKPLFVKSFNTTKAPRIEKVASHLLEWTWISENPPPFEVESNMPFWHSPVEQVQVTQFTSWQEVVSHLMPLYAFSEILDPEMTALVNQWIRITSHPEEQARLALRFVQDEIQYRGFEEGIKGYQPSDPRTIFQRRSGDCKEKSVLLQALLQMMGISSHPVYVNSKIGKMISEFLPGITFFDHVILKIDIGDSSYWVDTTMECQGGPLAKNYCPEYEWGLVIAPETDCLTPLPKSDFLTPTIISTQIQLLTPETAEATSQITCHGLKAEQRRFLMKQSGAQKFAERCLRLFSQNSKLILPCNISDDRENNIFTMTLTYQFPTKTRARKKVLPIDPQTLQIALDGRFLSPRKTPYILQYPLWIQEHIHVENPFANWKEESDEMSEEHPSLIYKSSFKISGHTADYDFELRHLQDHVPAESAQSYADLIHRIETPEPLKIN